MDHKAMPHQHCRAARAKCLLPNDPTNKRHQSDENLCFRDCWITQEHNFSLPLPKIQSYYGLILGLCLPDYWYRMWGRNERARLSPQTATLDTSKYYPASFWSMYPTKCKAPSSKSNKSGSKFCLVLSFFLLKISLLPSLNSLEWGEHHICRKCQPELARLAKEIKRGCKQLFSGAGTASVVEIFMHQ